MPSPGPQPPPQRGNPLRASVPAMLPKVRGATTKGPHAGVASGGDLHVPRPALHKVKLGMTSPRPLPDHVPGLDMAALQLLSPDMLEELGLGPSGLVNRTHLQLPLTPLPKRGNFRLDAKLLRGAHGEEGEEEGAHRPSEEEDARSFATGLEETVDYVEKYTYVERILLADWWSSFQKESGDYRSLALFAEMKLAHIIDRSRHLGVPNYFRTVACCEIFDKLCGVFDRYGVLLRRLKEEIMLSCFANYAPPWRGEAGHEEQQRRIPFFALNECLMHQIKGLLEREREVKKVYMSKVQQANGVVEQVAAFHGWRMYNESKRRAKLEAEIAALRRIIARLQRQRDVDAALRRAGSTTPGGLHGAPPAAAEAAGAEAADLKGFVDERLEEAGSFFKRLLAAGAGDLRRTLERVEKYVGEFFGEISAMAPPEARSRRHLATEWMQELLPEALRPQQQPRFFAGNLEVEAELRVKLVRLLEVVSHMKGTLAPAQGPYVPALRADAQAMAGLGARGPGGGRRAHAAQPDDAAHPARRPLRRPQRRHERPGRLPAAAAAAAAGAGASGEAGSEEGAGGEAGARNASKKRASFKHSYSITGKRLRVQEELVGMVGEDGSVGTEFLASCRDRLEDVQYLLAVSLGGGEGEVRDARLKVEGLVADLAAAERAAADAARSLRDRPAPAGGGGAGGTGSRGASRGASRAPSRPAASSSQGAGLDPELQAAMAQLEREQAEADAAEAAAAAKAAAAEAAAAEAAMAEGEGEGEGHEEGADEAHEEEGEEGEGEDGEADGSEAGGKKKRRKAAKGKGKGKAAKRGGGGGGGAGYGAGAREVVDAFWDEGAGRAVATGEGQPAWLRRIAVAQRAPSVPRVWDDFVGAALAGTVQAGERGVTIGSLYALTAEIFAARLGEPSMAAAIAGAAVNGSDGGEAARGRARDVMAEYVCSFMLNKYGLRKLAEDWLRKLAVTLWREREKDWRVYVVGQMCGLVEVQNTEALDIYLEGLGILTVLIRDEAGSNEAAANAITNRFWSEFGKPGGCTIAYTQAVKLINRLFMKRRPQLLEPLIEKAKQLGNIGRRDVHAKLVGRVPFEIFLVAIMQEWTQWAERAAASKGPSVAPSKAPTPPGGSRPQSAGAGSGGAGTPAAREAPPWASGEQPSTPKKDPAGRRGSVPLSQPGSSGGNRRGSVG
eukprot:tig00000237_g20481.t1